MIRPDTPETRELAARIISAGGLVAFRTDTFYGLGADPFNRAALAALRALKGREETKPILVVVGDRNEVGRFAAALSPAFDALAAEHWPGALTLVAAARAGVPEELTAGTGTVGLRLPGDEEVAALARACGGALTATSANPAGSAPARSALEVEVYFGGRLDLIVDGGETRAVVPSTVLDVSGPTPRLLREGEVRRARLEETLGRLGIGLGGAG